MIWLVNEAYRMAGKIAKAPVSYTEARTDCIAAITDKPRSIRARQHPLGSGKKLQQGSNQCRLGD